MSLKAKKVLSLLASVMCMLPLYVVLHKGGHALVAVLCGARVTSFSVAAASMSYQGGRFTALTLSLFHAAGVLLAQFNRSSQSGGAGGLPDLTWLKDSSLIEQLAHTVAFLHREETNVPNAPTLFYSRKTRNQAPFTTGFSLDWNGTGYTSPPAYDSSGIPQYSPGAEHD